MGIIKNESGSAAIIAVIIAVLVLGGGTVAYFATDGFGANKDEQTATSKIDKSKDNAKQKIASDDDSGKQVPAGFPSDMPIFKPSVIITSRVNDNKYSLGLQAKDAKEDAVVSFYKTELVKAGWSFDPNLAASSVLKVSKGNWTGSVTVHESTTTDLGTVISYILEKQ